MNDDRMLSSRVGEGDLGEDNVRADDVEQSSRQTGKGGGCESGLGLRTWERRERPARQGGVREKREGCGMEEWRSQDPRLKRRVTHTLTLDTDKDMDWS